MITVYTHAGIFHLDEMVAISILTLVYGKENISIKRVSKVDGIVEDENTIVVDIGGGKYDHHQATAEYRPLSPAARKMGKTPIKYAAAGLIWREFGNKLIPDGEQNGLFDQTFIKLVDAKDNGQFIAAYDGDGNELTVYSQLSGIVSHFNSFWDEDPENGTSNFNSALDLVTKIMAREIAYHNSLVRARETIDAIASKYDGNGIIVLDKYVPWQGTKLVEDETAKIIIFPAPRGGYNVQLVPVKPFDRETRISVPKTWWANPAESGVDGCTFIHATGFLSNCKTLESALEFANKVISLNA